MWSATKVKGRYEIREKLGAGGMGAVYRAYDKVIKSDVALKVLLDVSDPTALRMFREECDKLARLVHPNIVEIRDIGELQDNEGKRPFLVMPLLRGVTLDRLIRDASQRLTVERGVEMLHQTCRGLQAAHDAGIVHRDLKPSNIFVLDDDCVKIIDFGVAHWAETIHTVGRKGTLLYMSPEQVELKGSSPQSDIFSLGAVAYEALTGKRVFERRTEDDVVNAILNYIPPPASDYNPLVNQSLSKAVHKAMAKQAFHRFRSAKEFGETLKKALHNQPIEIFNSSRIQPRVQRSAQAFDRGDLELAGEILAELEAEGHLDPDISELRRKIDFARRQKTINHLLDSARTRLEEQEFPLALQKIQEALKIDANNANVLALKENIESRRAEQSINDWLQLARQHIENFAHDRAREALQNVLQLKPNDARALSLLSEVGRKQQEYNKVLQEKERLHQAAVEAFDCGDVSTALSKMNKVLELDRQAPNRATQDRGTTYQSFYNQIRSAHDAIRMAYAEARRLQAESQHEQALEICNQQLAIYPGNALFQALTLDLEVSQRQLISSYIAEIDRRVDQEPDLDKRVAILKEAVERYPNLEHFTTNYRLAREKRELIESIVSKARVLDERGQLSEALGQWEILQSIYPRYPGLDFELERLTRRRDQQARAEARAKAIDQIEGALAGGDYVRALSLLEPVQREFPGDAELQALHQSADEGNGRTARAAAMLAEASDLQVKGRFEEAVSLLRHARELDNRNHEIIDALPAALVEQARGLLGADWRAAEALLNEAVSIGAGNAAVKGLLRAVADHRRDEEISRALNEVRSLQASGDIWKATRLLDNLLAKYPAATELVQFHTRLRKSYEEHRNRDLQELSELDREAGTRTDPEYLRSALEKSSGYVSRYPGDEDFQVVERKIRARLSTATSESEDGAPGPVSALPASLSAPVKPAPRRLSWLLTRIRHRLVWAGAVFALLVLIAAVLVSWKPGPRATPLTRPAPLVASDAMLSIRAAPAGAELLIDGTQQTPEQADHLRLKPGPHEIEVNAPGYRSERRRVNLKPGETSNEAFTLALLPASLRLDADLASGRAFLDGNPMGSLQGGQLLLDPAPAGAHTLTVSGRRSEIRLPFDSTADGITLASPPTVRDALVLTVAAAAGKIRVACSREGITLRLNEQAISDCNAAGVELPEPAAGTAILEVLDGEQIIARKLLELGPAPALTAIVLTKSEFGRLLVTANQQDFTVLVNGHEMKTAPRHGTWRLSMPPADYLVQVKKEGFRSDPAEARITIQRGNDSAQQFTLTPIPVIANLFVRTEPGAEIFLSGRAAGNARTDGVFELPNLSPGSVEIRVHKPGFIDRKETIPLKQGQNELTLTLQKPQPRLLVNIWPKRAQVIAVRAGSSEPFNIIPGSETELPEGLYRLDASAPGFKPRSVEVKVAPGEAVKQDITLEMNSPVVPPLPTPAPVVWTGWTKEAGWLLHKGGGMILYPATAAPRRIAFTAAWQRAKGIDGLFASNALHCYFQAAKREDAIFINVDPKGFSWDRTPNRPKSNGRKELQLAKGEHSIVIDIRAEGVTTILDGASMPVIPVDLTAPDFAPARFGFRIDHGETLRIKDFQFE